MRSIKLLSLSLLAVFALGVFVATSASAEEGFLPTSKANFLSEEIIFEFSSKTSLKCAKTDASSVTFTNDKTATVTLQWLGCKALGFPLNSTGDKAETILVPIKLLVCLDPKNSAGTLLAEFGLAAEITGTVALEIPAIGSKIEVKGTALGTIATKGKAKLYGFVFAGVSGEETTKECLQGTTKIVHNLLANTNGGAFELVRLEFLVALIQFEKEAELMDS